MADLLSIIVGAISVILAIYTIQFAKKESKRSEENYNRAQNLLNQIEKKSELIDRAIQFQQVQLVEIINKSLDKIGATPIDLQPMSAEEIEAMLKEI